MAGLLAGAAPACVAQSSSGTSAAGLHYTVSGTGPPVVLLHAFSLDLRMWDDQVAVLERTHQVIRYDLRGHGQSAPPTEPYTGHGDLLALLDELHVERADLVGLSAGAELAVNFAIAHPDRVGRLVLAAPGITGYPAPPMSWFGPVGEAASAGDLALAARRWTDTPIMTLHRNPAAGPRVASLVMDNARLWGLRRIERFLDPPAATRLPEICAPVLVVVGAADLPHILDIARMLVDGVAGATLITMPGAGHLVNLEAPDAFNDLLVRFLGHSD